MKSEYGRYGRISPRTKGVLAFGSAALFLLTVSLFAADGERTLWPTTNNKPAAPAPDQTAETPVNPAEAADPTSGSETLDILSNIPEETTPPAADDNNPTSSNYSDFLERPGRPSKTTGNPPRTVRQQLTVRIPTDPAAAVQRNIVPLPSGVTLGENDIQAKIALSDIPKGEGYEAKVSANTQGKLVVLGKMEMDENGQLKRDENGDPLMKPLRRGMIVNANDVLGVQFNQANLAQKEKAKRELEVARKEADKKLEIEVAAAGQEVARMEYIRALRSNEQVANSVSAEEVMQKKFEWYRQVKSTAKAEYDREVADVVVNAKEADVMIADAQLEERLLRSPISGQIDVIYKNQGEWLREGDEVFHVIRLDKVNIQARFDSATTSTDMVEGKAVTVYVSRAGKEPQALEGVITYARPVIEMGTFEAYAEVKNEQVDGSWVLMPGMMVNLVVHKDQEGHIEDDAPVPVPVSSNSFVTHEIETLTPPVQEGNREEAKEAVDKARATILQDDLRNVLDPQATETP